MAKSFAQLTQELEALAAKVEAARKKEAAGVAARIKEAIVIYGFTAEDLGLGGNQNDEMPAPMKAAAPKASKPPKAVGKKKLAAKYRDAAGNSWTGRGSRPRWMVAALAAGRSLESLTVGGVGTKSPSVAKKSDSANAVKPKTLKTTKSTKSASVAKYRDADGHAWSGMGPKPGWLKEALAAGKALEDLTV